MGHFENIFPQRGKYVASVMIRSYPDIWATFSPGRSYLSTRTMASLHGTKKMALMETENEGKVSFLHQGKRALLYFLVFTQKKGR